MAATFAVQSFPLTAPQTVSTVGPMPAFGDGVNGVGVSGNGNGNRVGPTMEIESKMEMAGRVRVLNFFTHHVNARADCKVVIAVSDGSVLGFHC